MLAANIASPMIGHVERVAGQEVVAALAAAPPQRNPPPRQSPRRRPDKPAMIVQSQKLTVRSPMSAHSNRAVCGAQGGLARPLHGPSSNHDSSFLHPVRG